MSKQLFAHDAMINDAMIEMKLLFKVNLQE